VSRKNDVISSYRGARGLAYQLERSEVPASVYKHVARVRASKFQPFIGPETDVLEYGVGIGLNLAELECKQKVGFDVADFLEERLRVRGIQFLSELGGHTFDAIICHHVLEHVAEPWETLCELKRLLRPRGLLLLFVPYEHEKNKYKKFDPEERNRHLYSWTPQTLGMLASCAGFSVEDIRLQWFGYDRVAAVIADKVGGAETLYRVIRRTLLLLNPHREIRALLRRS